MRLVAVLCVVCLFGLVGVADAATATLTWSDKSTNELGFNVERKDSECAGAASWFPLAGVGANIETYVDPTVASGSTYCYRVNAWNEVTPGGSRQYSAWSNTAGLTVPFPVPAAPGPLGVAGAP